eukprot:GHVL01010931.1.p1 GENE.GHVL01010931.1~~GHVL01010931.1.p1  ORF type:complete len:229 (-),score=20.57 GHVL01010931.1:94-780(-)
MSQLYTQRLQKKALRTIGFGWAAFAGSHLLLSDSSIRYKFVGLTSEKTVVRVNSLIALATFVPTSVFYVSVAEACSWTLTIPRRLAATSCYAVAVLLLVDTLWCPNHLNPFFIWGDKELEWPVGSLRITRHPINMSLGLIGIGGLILHTHPIARLYWMGYPLLAIIGSYHQEIRWRRSGNNEIFLENTDTLPFESVVRGKQRVDIAMDEVWLWAKVAAGIIIAMNFVI